MSKTRIAPSLIIEWSPGSVTAYDATSGRLTTGASLRELAASGVGGSATFAASRRVSFVRTARVPNAKREVVEKILEVQLSSIFPVPLEELSYGLRLTADLGPEGRLAVLAGIRNEHLRQLYQEAREAGFKVERVVLSACGAMGVAQAASYADCAVVQSIAEGLAVDVVLGGELRYSRVGPMPASEPAIEAEALRTFAAAGVGCYPVIAAGRLTFSEADSIVSKSSLEALVDLVADGNAIELELAEDVRARQVSEQTRRLVISSAYLVGALLLAGLAYLSNARAVASAGMARNAAQESLNKLNASLATESSLAGKWQQMDGVLQRTLFPAQGPGDVITEVTNQVPDNVWLTGITFTRGKPLVVRGTAMTNADVNVFYQHMTDDTRFRDVQLLFESNGTIDKAPVVEFSLQAFPIGNLPLIDDSHKEAEASK